MRACRSMDFVSWRLLRHHRHATGDKGAALDGDAADEWDPWDEITLHDQFAFDPQLPSQEQCPALTAPTAVKVEYHPGH